MPWGIVSAPVLKYRCWVYETLLCPMQWLISSSG